MEQELTCQAWNHIMPLPGLGCLCRCSNLNTEPFIRDEQEQIRSPQRKARFLNTAPQAAAVLPVTQADSRWEAAWETQGRGLGTGPPGPRATLPGLWLSGDSFWQGPL